MLHASLTRIHLAATSAAALMSLFLYDDGLVLLRAPFARGACVLIGLLLVALGILAAFVKRLRPRSALMELADHISAPSTALDPVLQERLDRHAVWRAAAGPPPTPEDELALLDYATPSPRFALADDENGWLAHLDTHGYAVVDLNLPQSTLPHLKGLLWAFLEQHAEGWKRGQPETWSDDGLCRVGSPVNGVLNGRGVGHSNFLWAVRTLPAVRAAFARLWGVSSAANGGDDAAADSGGGSSALATSFDGGNVFRPWHPLNPATAERCTRGGWWHVDQGRGKVGQRHAVQGLVTLFDADATTGGLCVVPGSHRKHAEVVGDQALGQASRDFVPVPYFWPGFGNGCPRRRLVRAQAGDLVLWDSRTVHCNAPARASALAPLHKATPLPPLPTAAPLPPVSARVEEASAATAEPARPAATSAAEPAERELLRAVAYVCMTPKAWGTPALRLQRQAAYAARVTTSHWPHEFHPGMPGPASDPPLNLDTAHPARRALI
jgi:hypothetical protein